MQARRVIPKRSKRLCPSISKIKKTKKRAENTGFCCKKNKVAKCSIIPVRIDNCPLRRASLKCPYSLLCYLDVEPLYLRQHAAITNILNLAAWVIICADWYLAELCGYSLALAHCRGDRRSTRFASSASTSFSQVKSLLVKIANLYTEQVVDDHALFTRALK